MELQSPRSPLNIYVASSGLSEGKTELGAWLSFHSNRRSTDHYPTRASGQQSVEPLWNRDHPRHPRKFNLRSLRRTVRGLMPVLARLEARLVEGDFEKGRPADRFPLQAAHKHKPCPRRRT